MAAPAASSTHSEQSALMRRIGQLPDPALAERLRDYLADRGIAMHLDVGADATQIWVLDEDRVTEARQELAQFESCPQGERFLQGAAAYRQRQAEQLESALAARRGELGDRRRRRRGPIRSAPITFLVIVLCGIVTAATRFGDDQATRNRLLISGFETPPDRSVFLPEIERGQLWRLVTPSFIHFDLLHLLGNASWMYLLGRVIEQTRTRLRFVLLLAVLAVGSNVAQYLVAGPAFGGLSGVDCGLFGYLWFKTYFRPESGFELAPDQTFLFAGWMVICLTGLAGPIANTAHISGMILGMLLALPRSVPVFR